MFEKKYTFLDKHFGRFLAGLSNFTGKEREKFQHLVQDVSASLSEGHSCLPIGPEEVRLLRKTSLVSGGDASPLVLKQNHLYLQKYYLYETRLARQLSVLAKNNTAITGDRGLLESCFSSPNGVAEDVDWQKKAAEMALEKKLCIISGGPGTGKTSTVVKIIGLLFQHLGGDQKIGLAAPTGKAAMRLRASISENCENLSFPQHLVEKIPTDAMTLHRLLGVQRFSPQFKYNKNNPLFYDVVVVDEASMIDLALMSKLVDALKPGAQLILLGDSDQLASVESGAVLADLIGSLPDNTIELKQTFRFNTGIKKVAEYIKNGDSDRTWELLQGQHVENVSLLETPLATYIGSCYMNFMDRVRRVKEEGTASIFYTFNSFRVLCALRHGKYGVEGVNFVVEQYLNQNGFTFVSGSWYPGRPVLITRNDYSLGLYNGDIGICLRDDDGTLKVWSEQPDTSYLCLPPYRLPQCETAYGMTIHKSQGSEFEEVLVVLPEEDNQVLCRELLYTAVTRAKQDVKILAKEEVLKVTLSRNMVRFSGLSESIEKFIEKSD